MGTWSYSSEDYSTDEEYVKIIAGAEAKEDDDIHEEKEAWTSLIKSLAASKPQSEILTSFRNEREESKVIPSTLTLSSRLSVLEKQVEENTTLTKQNSLKLDRILHLLNELHCHNQNNAVSS